MKKLLIFPFLLSLIIIFGCDAISNLTKGDPPILTEIGKVISTNKFEIEVQSIETSNHVGNEFFNSKPAEGALFITVIYTYKNISKKPIGMFSFPDAKLIDSEGTEYDKSDEATVNFGIQIKETEKVTSDLNPGIKVKSGVVFEIAKEYWNKSNWKLRIDADKTIEINVN